MNFRSTAIADIRMRMQCHRAVAADKMPHYRHALALMQGADLLLQLTVVASDAFVLSGSYRFHIAAAKDDGVWNARCNPPDFVIDAAFVQTWQFKARGALALLLALGIAWHMRMRHVAGSLRARLEERYRERERIARGLHDTLLQGTQELILRLHAASRSLHPGRPAPT